MNPQSPKLLTTTALALVVFLGAFVSGPAACGALFPMGPSDQGQGAMGAATDGSSHLVGVRDDAVRHSTVDAAGVPGQGELVVPLIPTEGTSSAQLLDLEGTWYFQGFADLLTYNQPYWVSGTMVVDATGAVTGGSYVDEDEDPGTIFGGAFTINGDGQVSGTVLHSTTDGPPEETENFPYGQLDSGNSVLAMVNSNPDARGLLVALKGGGTFSQADLHGTWHVQVMVDDQMVNQPAWAFGTMDIDAAGQITAAAITSDEGKPDTVVTGTLTINSDGEISGSVVRGDGRILNFPHGKLNLEKTFLTMVATTSESYGLCVAIKGGGTFTQADLAGLWKFQLVRQNLSTNDPHWASGTMLVDATGTVTSVTYVDSEAQTGTIVSGAFTIDGGGQTSLTVVRSTGDTEDFPNGKLDDRKSILTMVNSSPDIRGLLVAIKAPPPLPEVTVRAATAKATASEKGCKQAKFKVSRNGDTSRALIVNYAISGTAKNGVDYNRLSGKVTIPAGSAAANIIVKPFDDHAKEPDETVTVTLKETPRYTVGSPGSATITIADDD